MDALVTFAASIALALVLTPLTARLAIRAGVVDRPGPLKVHQAPVPYLGGVAVFVAAGATMAPEHPRLLLPLGLALTLGIADDVAALPPALRVGGGLVVAAAAGWAAPATAGLAGGALTAAMALGLLNAVNLLDGLDGLAGSVAAVSALAVAVVDHGSRLPALALAGALAGFLWFNRPPARVYLGDGGAYCVGTALALLVALALRGSGDVAAWAAAPLLVAVPVIDTAVAIGRRVLARRPLFGGDRTHVYDQLVDRGTSRVVATLVLVAAQTALAGVAVVTFDRGGVTSLALTAACAVLVLGAILALGFLTPPTPPGSSGGVG